MSEIIPQATSSVGAIAPEDRTLAMLTHLSGLAGYIIPLGGIIVPIVIWFIKSENKAIAAIAKQAIILNIAVFVCVLALALIALTIVLLPVSIIGWIVLGLAAIVLPIVGAVKASDGEYYSYPVIGTRP
ncbi:MAG: DUF4870 domain-containing protein [Acidobacteria bacterium]|nr:MAG: DUF4870 domain-containing protein [Acidobacteriota bacterium]